MKRRLAGDLIIAFSKLPDVEVVIRTEDLLDLAHNAVRGGQTGNLDEFPEGFDRIGDGGAIHQRRHSRTGALHRESSGARLI